MSKALEGVRIADFTQMMQGPWATQKLADMGADVVKIERVGGEWERGLGAGGELLGDVVSPFFLAMNRNKRSLTLDLKSDEGRQAALEVIAEADVLVENFRPGVMDRLGLGYDDAQSVNPEIIYVSASGFGSDGPYVDRPGQDLLLQAMSGLTAYTGRGDDPPTPVGTAVVDEHSASQIALSIMIALFHKERTGEGQRVEANLLNAAIDFQCQEITAVLNMDREFDRSDAGIAQAWIGAPYGIYETADGHVAIAMSPLDLVAEAVDLPALADYDETAAYEQRDDIKRQLESETVEWPTDELLEALLEHDIWAAAVNDFHEMAADPQVQHNGMLVEMDYPGVGEFTTTGLPTSFSETPGRIASRPPTPGEHSAEILAEHGYSEAEIDTLVEADVTSIQGDAS